MKNIKLMWIIIAPSSGAGTQVDSQHKGLVIQSFDWFYVVNLDNSRVVGEMRRP